MKVIYYCDWFKEYTSSLAIAASDHGVKVALIMRPDSIEFRQHRDDEVRIHAEVIDSGVDLRLLSGKYSSIRSVLEIRRTFRKLQRQGFGCFHIQQTGDPRFLWMTLRVPTILTVHEPVARQGVSSGAGRLRDVAAGLIERLYRLIAKRIVVHTQANMDALTPREKRKAFVIPHGVTPVMNHSNSSKTILFFGRAAGYKGIDILFTAMKTVWRAVPDARLRILASAGDYQLSSDLTDDRISATWDGYSNRDLENALSEARAVCLPYTSASGSGVAAQAYGWGIPIVASDLQGLNELVTDHRLLANPGCADDLARALIVVLAEDHIVQDFDGGKAWTHVARTHMDIYRSVYRGFCTG